MQEWRPREAQSSGRSPRGGEKRFCKTNPPRRSERLRSRTVLTRIPNGEVGAIRMLKHKRTHAGLRIHHEALRQLHADLFRPQQLPNSRLIFQIRARRIAKAVSLPAVARSKSLRHGHFRRIGEALIFADTPVQPFVAGFGCFNCQGLQAVRLAVIALVFAFSERSRNKT